ncbi:hypothetical protein HYH02_003127 [Chlamydomonas schloesseri]|uniref:Protein ENHANCED DISEASE RESISTANCE 2 C-terminal domain-containing protein n=1 Tax=Chlamydomonas schloesseri TaxID=2026947 RepID=A0A836B9U6_9CHLO|nr:hypothetical protein HYH02_003127 [Chlamydomonas schloesseri]|eukprot:KAG2452092.1 hypothetical protein HYH02_003127 [Chlamydomonas schloesseri]
MASDYGNEDGEHLLEETDVYKATSSSDFVVVRRLRLYRNRFVTYHNFEETEEDNKQWLLTRGCDLSPRTAAEIKEPVTKYVRPRGQWAITTLVKPTKSSKAHAVRLYMFTLNWPTKWAAKGYTSFTFGFTTAEEARHWHARLGDCIELIRLEKAAAASSGGAGGGVLSTMSSYRTPGQVSGNTTPLHTSTLPPPFTYYSVGGAAAANAAGGGGGGSGGASTLTKQRSASGAGALSKSSSLQHTATTPTLDRGGSSRDAPRSHAGDLTSPSSPGGMAGAPPLAAGAVHRRSMTAASEPANRFPGVLEGDDDNLASLVGGGGGGSVGGAPKSHAHANGGGSMPVTPGSPKAFRATSASAPADAAPTGGGATASTSAGAARPSVSAAAAGSAANGARRQGAQAPARHAPQVPRPPMMTTRLEGGFSPSSSDSDGEADDGEEMGGGRGVVVVSGMRRRGSAATTSAPCRLPRGSARYDVRQTRGGQRWVPYKQVNGVAIYHRRQTAGDTEAGMGGEFMVSTVVRGSPRRCLEALTSKCGNTTILGPAILQEVLQARHADDEKEVLRIILQAPGATGVLCAPRELVVETLFKTDDSGPTLVLMFNSCEPPARFVERKEGGAGGGGGGGGNSPTAGTPQQQQQQQQQQEQQDDIYQASNVGNRRSWWGRPVPARVRGGYTMAPLEEHSLDSSPEALVTCIMKVDLGGVCGERSWLRLASELVGWTDAFLDRMLMAVTLLRDEVEQGRFVVQPLSMVASQVKERERDATSAADLSSLVSGRSHEGSGAVLSGAGGGTGATRRCLPSRLQTVLGGGSVTAAGGRPASSSAAVGDGGSPTVAGTPHESPLLVDALDDDAHAAAAAAAGGHGHGHGHGAHDAAHSAFADGDGKRSAELAAAAAAGAAAAAAAAAVVAMGPRDMPAGAGAEGGGDGAPRYTETMADVLERMRRLAFLDPSVWDQLHQPGKDAPFKVRGPTYLKDRKKIPAGNSRFVLGAMDVIAQPPGPTPHEHVARFLPSVRESGAPFMVIIHLVIPGTPLLGIVATFVTDRHPSALGRPPAHPMEDDHDWEPFDFVLHKYMTGSTHARNHCLKLIPHIADGSWMIKQSVGTTPVILGKQLRTIYYETPQYIEIDIDISANNVASYVTGLVRGATRSLVIDMGFVFEGTTPWELPEALLGTLRLYNLDCRNAKLIDVNHEIPLRPPTVAPPPVPPSRLARGSFCAAGGGSAAGVGLAPAPPSGAMSGGGGGGGGGSGGSLHRVASVNGAPTPIVSAPVSALAADSPRGGSPVTAPVVASTPPPLRASNSINSASSASGLKLVGGSVGGGSVVGTPTTRGL